MTVRTLSMLQWAGLVVGGMAWATQHIFGYFVTEATCGSSRTAAGSHDTLQGLFMAIGITFILAAEAAALSVILKTREASYDETDPPIGRIRFLAIAAAASNLIFLVIVILTGTASIVDNTCVPG